MNSFLDLLRTLFEYAFPLKAISSYEQGVRFTFLWSRTKTELLEPGFYFQVPFFQRIQEVSVVYQQIDLQDQSLETTDGVSLYLSANIGYTIEDAVLYFTEVHDFDTTIERRARGLISRYVRRHTAAEVHQNLRTIERGLARTLNHKVREWGVNIEDVYLTDFVRAKTYRIAGTKPF